MPIGLLGLGFFSGMRHAFDIDHVAAISAISSRHSSINKSSMLGMFWGLGHTASLLAVGLAVLLLKTKIPHKLALSLEFIVAAMLIILGISVLLAIRREKMHLHRHKHGNIEHAHFHSHKLAEYHGHGHIQFKKPLVIGLVHGLAGSAALTLLILADIPSTLLGLAYILIFGAGSILGMMFLSAIISLPFRLMSSRLHNAQQLLRAGTGLISITIGFAMIL